MSINALVFCIDGPMFELILFELEIWSSLRCGTKFRIARCERGLKDFDQKLKRHSTLADSLSLIES